MGFIRKKDLFGNTSVKILFPLFWKSRLTANQITVINFFTLNLWSVALFASGREVLGLLVTGLGAMVDVIDGSIARAGRGLPNGKYLDTSLDWIYLMLFIGSISYYHNMMVIGYLCLIAITWGNWVEFNGKTKWELPFPFGIKHLVTIGVLTGHLGLGLIGICITQWLRTLILYMRSINVKNFTT